MKSLSTELIERHGFDNYIKMIKNDAEIVFNTESGKRLMDFLEWQFHYDSGTYFGDVTQMHINEGKRQAILTIKTLVDKDEEAVLEGFKQG